MDSILTLSAGRNRPGDESGGFDKFIQEPNFVTFVIFAIFAIFVTEVFSLQEKSLLLLRLLRYLRTFRGPSWLLLFLSLDSC